jgi:Spy/CpxP family protein refolding chaperone
MQKKHGSLLLTLMLLGGLAAAEGTEWGSKKNRDEMRSKMKTELGLSKEQEKKLETHRIDQRAEMEKLILVVKEKREELKKGLEDPQLNRGSLERINSDLKDAQNEMADKRLEGILYVREVLTPDQFKKFLALRPGRGEKGKNRGGHGQGDHHKNHGYESKQGGHDNDHDAMDEGSMEMPKGQ